MYEYFLLFELGTVLSSVFNGCSLWIDLWFELGAVKKSYVYNG